MTPRRHYILRPRPRGAGQDGGARTSEVARDEIGIGMDAEESDLAAPTTKTRFDEDWLSALRR